METLKIRNLMLLKKKENSEFLEACALLREYCAKIKKKKKKRIVSRWANIIRQKIVTRTVQQFKLARSSCCSWKSPDSRLFPLTDIGSRIYRI